LVNDQLPIRLAAPAAAGGAYVPTVFVGMYATQGQHNFRVSKLTHYYGFNHLHYLTVSAYRRACIFDSERFKRHLTKAVKVARME
jgi:hypothetical protein